jgi:hypothetical protein
MKKEINIKIFSNGQKNLPSETVAKFLPESEVREQAAQLLQIAKTATVPQNAVFTLTTSKRFSYIGNYVELFLPDRTPLGSYAFALCLRFAMIDDKMMALHIRVEIYDDNEEIPELLGESEFCDEELLKEGENE